MRSLHKLHRPRLLASALLVAPLALAACGGDDDDSIDAPEGAGTVADPAADAEPAGTDAASVPASAGTAGSGEAADREEWVAVGAQSLNGGDAEFDRCLSEGVVDGIGYENLAGTGATPDEFWSASDISQFDFSIEDMGDVAGRLDECGDLIDYFAGVSGGTEAQIDCMRENFNDEDVAAVIVAAMIGVEPSDDLVAKQEALRACADAAEGD